MFPYENWTFEILTVNGAAAEQTRSPYSPDLADRQIVEAEGIRRKLVHLGSKSNLWPSII